MNRQEITAMASGLVSLAMTVLLVWLAAVYTWNGSGLLWMLALISATGVATSIGALWTLGQRRREADAEAAAAASAGTARWGADAHESALSEERERLGVVRTLLERKLATGVGVFVLLAALAGGWILGWKWLILDADRIDEWALKKKREDKAFVMPVTRFRQAAGICALLGSVSLTMAATMRAAGRRPGAAVLAAEAGYHQIRAFAFLLAAGTLAGDTIAQLPENSYWRSFRWTVLLPPCLLLLKRSHSIWGGLGIIAVGLIDDIIIAGMAGNAAGDAPWSPVVAWALVGVMAWQACEILWNALTYRRDAVEGFMPVPPAESQGLVQFMDGRGLHWLTTGMAGNFGAEFEEAAARRFLVEHVGGTLLAVAFLFYMSTCFVTIRPWEVGIRERFGQMTQIVDSRKVLLVRAKNNVPEGHVWVHDAALKTYRVPTSRGETLIVSEEQLAAQGLKVVEPDPEPELLAPGLHLKFPWPIERVVTIETTTLQEMTFGNAGHSHDTDVIWWSGDHYDKEFEMLTGDKMLASVVATMHFRVKDPVAYFRNIYPEFAEDRKSQDEAAGEEEIKKAADENYSEPVRKNRGARHGARALMAQVGYRALTDVVSRNSIWALMAENRGFVPAHLRRPTRGGRAEDLESEIRRNVQERLDTLGSGLEVARVCLTDVHPPVKEQTAERYEQIVSALEVREMTINEAQAAANRELPAAKGQAQQIIATAMSDSVADVRNAAGAAAVHKGVADVRAGKSRAAQDLIDARLISQSRLRMLGERQMYVLSPGLPYRLIVGEDKTLEDVIGPAGTAAELNKLPGR